MKYLASALIVMILAISGCSDRLPDTYVINDFEVDSDLDRLGWKCHTLYSLSEENVTHGKTCLHVTMHPPSDYPGVNFRNYIHDWRPYNRLAMDIYNPENQGDIRMTVRIDDKEETPEYEDRVNQRILLKPGMNHITLTLDSLITPSGRPLDLRHIYAFMMFMVKPPQPVSLYVDHVRLDH